MGLVGVCPSLFSDVKLVATARIPPVFQATAFGDPSRLRALLKAGENPNERTPWGWAPLHQAMFVDTEVCRVLINGGADVNIRTAGSRLNPNNGWTPIYYAVSQGRYDLVKDLLAAGADVNLIDAAGHPPLFYAIQREQREIASLLRSSGADKLPQEPQPKSEATPAFYPNGPGGPAANVPPLYQAVLMHNKRRVKTLLEDGANPNEKSGIGGWLPLHHAMHGDLETCRTLLEFGANPNARVGQNRLGQTNGWTPIFIAVYNGRADLVNELLCHGASADITDSVGRSPLWYARQRRDKRIVQMLEAALATRT